MKWLVLALFVIGCGGPSTSGGASDRTVANHPGKLEGSPYALAIVVNGWEIWMGNEELLPADDPSRYLGALHAIKDGVSKSTFAKTAPGGSQAMVVTYADRPSIRLPLGPVEKLDAAAFGTQKDYFGKTGVELVSGIELAAAELDKVKGGNKYMFVISDGNDTNNDAAVSRLTKLKADLATRGIVVVSFVYKAALSGESTVITKLAAESQMLSSTDALTTALQNALDGLAKRAN